MNAKAFLELIRPVNDVMSAFAVFISGVISAGWHLPLISILAATLGTFLASAGGMVINDYFDHDIDRINKPHRPIPRGDITRRGALTFSLLLFGGALLCALFTNRWCILVGVLAVLLMIWYSWKLKRMLFVGNVAVAILSALALVYGGIVTGSIQLVSILGVIAFFGTISREIGKDIEDVEGDRLGGARTVPVVLGIRTAAWVAGGFLLVAVALSFLPFVYGIFDWSYVFMLTPVNLLMLYVMVLMLQQNVDISSWQKTVKVGMYITLGIFLVSRLL